MNKSSFTHKLSEATFPNVNLGMEGNKVANYTSNHHKIISKNFTPSPTSALRHMNHYNQHKKVDEIN